MTIDLAQSLRAKNQVAGSIRRQTTMMVLGGMTNVTAPNDLQQTYHAPAIADSVTRRVLVVDDNTDLAEATRLILTASGYTVETTNLGRGALEKGRSFEPRIVLLDIGLPDIDGYEVARRLRQFPELESVILIAISAREPRTDPLSAQQARFDHYLTKPVDFATLLKLLSQKSL
jgi:two-component system CheB/CheR fusion protein